MLPIWRTMKHKSTKNLSLRASRFKPIDRESLNVSFEDAVHSSEVVGHIKGTYAKHLLVGNLGWDELKSIRNRPDILHKLNNNQERTLAVHLHKVILNDPLRTGVKDSFVDTLLRELSFGLYPLNMNLQDRFSFKVGDARISAKPEFSVEKDFSVVFFDEDKHFHGIGPNNEYGECQIAAEIIGCAYRNFSEPDDPRFEQDQIIHAVRTIGTRFTFYKSTVPSSYLHSLSNGFPPESEKLLVLRFPNKQENRLGYDFADPIKRPLILQLLVDLRAYLIEM